MKAGICQKNHDPIIELLDLAQFFLLVGLLGIEPSLSAPKADVLPVYYSPMND